MSASSWWQLFNSVFFDPLRRVERRGAVRIVVAEIKDISPGVDLPLDSAGVGVEFAVGVDDESLPAHKNLGGGKAVEGAADFRVVHGIKSEPVRRLSDGRVKKAIHPMWNGPIDCLLSRPPRL